MGDITHRHSLTARARFASKMGCTTHPGAAGRALSSCLPGACRTPAGTTADPRQKDREKPERRRKAGKTMLQPNQQIDGATTAATRGQLVKQCVGGRSE